MRYKNKKGFTLIELLVVIAIISLLASVVMVAVQRSRLGARNANRKQEASTLRKAMELYYNSAGTYPNGGPVSLANRSYDVASLSSFLVPNYMAAVPYDPSCRSGGTCNYQYAWSATGSAYAILIRFGNESGQTDCQIRVGNIATTVFTVPDCNY